MSSLFLSAENNGGPESLSSLENGHVPFYNMKMKNVNFWWVLAKEKRYVTETHRFLACFLNEIRSDYHHPLSEELKTRLLSIINHSLSNLNYQPPFTNGEWCSDIPVYRYRFPGLLVTEALEGPFTAVSKPIFSTEGSFCRIFQALQDWPAFALLQVKNLQFFSSFPHFLKVSAIFFRNLM